MRFGLRPVRSGAAGSASRAAVLRSGPGRGDQGQDSSIGFSASRRAEDARPVTIAIIDEKSMEKLGHVAMARTPDRGSRRGADPGLGAVVIALDVGFAEPDRPASIPMSRPTRSAIRRRREETRARLRALPATIRIFDDAISASRRGAGRHRVAGKGLPEDSPLDKDAAVTGLAMLAGAQQLMFRFRA